MRKNRVLAAIVFGGLAGFGVALFAAETGRSATYVEYCARCHGEDGRANTPKGKQLKAQDFTDQDWQSEKDDEELVKIVTEGGEDMPAFGRKLTKEQIEAVVKNDVRGFRKK